MDDIDRALQVAFSRVWPELQNNPDELARRFAAHAGSTYSRPLRTWSLVSRSHDTRLDARCKCCVTEYMMWDDEGPECAVEALEVTGQVVRELCKPVYIDWPGVSIDEAAARFGVNRTTIHRWAKAGRIVMDLYPRGSHRNTHRANKQIWTRSPVDPAGDLLTGPWGTIQQGLVQRIPLDWTQVVERTHKCLGTMSIMRFFRCPDCACWTTKLMLPCTIWTMLDAVGLRSTPPAACGFAPPTDHFTCWRCANLKYESAERTSHPAPGRRVNTWHRFINRISAGVLRGRDVVINEQLEDAQSG